MKKVTILFVMGLVLGVVGLSASIASAGRAETATGGIQAVAGGVGLQLNFNAHNTDPVKGIVGYSNTLGGWFRGDVDGCYFQDGNEARFAGTVTDGNYSAAYFWIEVQDNGEGGNATSPDRVRVGVTNSQPTCVLSGLFPGVVVEGNVQVH